MASPRRLPLLSLVGALTLGCATLPAAAEAAVSAGTVGIEDAAVVWRATDAGQVMSYAFGDDVDEDGECSNGHTCDPIVVFTADPDEALTISTEAVRDYGCAQQGGTDFIVSCFLHSAGTKVVGGRGDDTLQWVGRPANFPVRLEGGPGVDTVQGTSSADTIDVADGEPDTVTCEDGDDTVTADSTDRVDARSCEHVTSTFAPTRTTPLPTTPPATTTPPVTSPQPTTPITLVPPITTPQPTTPVATTPAARCVVPRLTGLSLAAAKTKLRAAGCAIGTTSPKHATGRNWVVRTQRTKAGRKVARHTKVSVSLRPKKKPAARRAKR